MALVGKGSFIVGLLIAVGGGLGFETGLVWLGTCGARPDRRILEISATRSIRPSS